MHTGQKTRSETTVLQPETDAQWYKIGDWKRRSIVDVPRQVNKALISANSQNPRKKPQVLRLIPETFVLVPLKVKDTLKIVHCLSRSVDSSLIAALTRIVFGQVSNGL